MNLEDFLERVLPVNGTNYYGAIIKDGKLYQTKLENLQALSNYIDKNKNENTFFATGSYVNNRTAEDAELRKSLFVDLDVGDSPDKYPDKKTAIEALLHFCADNFFKPSLVVDSGGGIHAYWVLNKPISAIRWKPLAEAFKALHEQVEFLADKPVTADAARYLRAPETINRKHNITTSIIYEGANVDYDEVSKKLAVASKPQLKLASALGVSPEDLSLKNNFPDIPRYARNLVEQCPIFIDALKTNGAGASEALWNNQLQVLTFCADGDEYVHEISKGYEGYTYLETQNKWNQKVKVSKAMGPVRCSTFASISSKCATCPYNGSIATPLQLGDRDSSMPWPYSQDGDGIHAMVPVDDKNSWERVLVVKDYNFKDFTASWGGFGSPLIIQCVVVLNKKEYRLELNTGADLHDRRQFMDVISKSAVIFQDYEVKVIKDLFMAWAKHIQRSNQLGIYVTHLGWVERNGFAVGRDIIFPGKRVKNKFSGAKNLQSLYEPKGEAAPWLDISHKLTSQGRYEVDTLVLTAFAAPLMEMLSDPSALMAFVSTTSGSGKTTGMQLAQAVWGHPIEAMNQLEDTQNSVLKKMGFTRNIPAYWDEIRAKRDVDKFLALILQLTGGKERGRMNRTTDLQETLTWNTILTLASNESIAAHANFASADSAAGRVRIFELVVPPIAEEHKLFTELATTRRLLSSNYGIIGPQYAEFLVNNHDAVSTMLQSVYKQLSDKLLKDPNERFWISTTTALIVASRLAAKLGYVKTDPAAFAPWILGKFKEQRQDRDEEYAPPEVRANDIVSQYLAEYQSQVIVYERVTKHGSPGNGNVTQIPRALGELAAGIATKDKLARLNLKLFREWCYKKGYGAPKDALQGVRFRAVHGRIGLSGTAEGVKIRCYDILNYNFTDDDSQ